METTDNIKSVSLNLPDRKDPLKDGAKDVFDVTTNDGTQVIVPIDTANRDYWVIREWYLAQKKKPFDFKFEALPEAKPEPETDEDGSGLVLTSNQIEDADLPEVNLTDDQLAELNSN